MTDQDPADFYTGLVAELYGRLRSSAPDAAECRNFIADCGEPALELGCGDGDPLLHLVRSGFDVDGVDSSQDMLDRLRRTAQQEGLAVRVYRQRMQALDLPRRYRSIFLAGPTFTVLPDDAAAAQTLRRIREHLEPDGTALVPLWVPGRTPEHDLGRFRDLDIGDGGSIGVAVIAEVYDEPARTRRSVLRYERRSVGGRADVLEREWLIHWYTPTGFRGLAQEVGLSVLDMRDESGAEPSSDCDYFTVRLVRSSAGS